MPFNIAKKHIYLFFWVLSFWLFQILIPDRSYFASYVFCTVFAFLFYILISKEEVPFRLYLFAFLLAVAPFFTGLPSLSDDFYRFYWDGYLWFHGYPVYEYSPAEFAEKVRFPSHVSTALSEMNSPNYYAVYTPLNQMIYALPFCFGSLSISTYVLVLRTVFLVFLSGGLFASIAVLNSQKFPLKNFWWFYGNPLVWIEGIGNLHIEIVLVSVLYLALLLWIKTKHVLSTLVMAAALSLKASSLPIFLAIALGVKHHKIRWYLVVLIGVVMLFNLLFLSGIDIQHILESLRLFNQTFEFNASIYEIVNAPISYHLGYNGIALTGKILLVVSLLIISIRGYATWKNNLNFLGGISFFSWASVCFLLFANTVHPWYLLIPLAAQPIIQNRFLLVWSLTVGFSYCYYQNYSISWWWLFEYLTPVLFLLEFRYRLGTGMKLQNGRS